MAGCWQLGISTATSYDNNPIAGDPIACWNVCKQTSNCMFYQWNHPRKDCKLFYSDIEEIYKDSESLLGVPDCNNYVSLLKKQLIAATTPIPTPTPPLSPPTTTTTKRTRTSLTTRAFSPAEASLGPGTGEILTTQNSTSARYTCHNRKGLKGEVMYMPFSIVSSLR
jgi:hypothetical protein